MLGSCLFLAVSLTGAPPAQGSAVPVQTARTTPVVHGLPGKRPGTERWCVVFRSRSFDLSKFRRAIHEGWPAAQVEAIVAELERLAVEDQAGFTRFVEQDLGGTVVAHFWLINACSIEVEPRFLDRVRKHPKVLYIHPDEEVRPVAILTSTNMKNHAVDALQSLGVKGKGVSVAIMDTGCDVNMGGSGRPHATYYVNGDITNKTGGGIGGSRLLAAKALGRMGADDVHSHGTAVSGIAAGEKWNKNANSDRGHSPMSGIVSYSIANNTRGSSDYTTIAKAWQAIAADKVTYKIVAANNSYSGSPDPTNISQQALDSAALNADVLPVVAAGNFSSSTRASQSCANGLAVGAVYPNTRKVATFSSRGPLYGDTTRFFPDLCANGVSTVMPKKDLESSQWIASGTSMASPQVCGAATLFRSVRTTANALETKAAILATTEDVSSKNPNPPYNTRNAYGVGYLRDDRLIALAKGGGLITRSTLTSAVKTRTFPFSVVKGKAYAVAIAWHRTKLTTKTWSNLALEVKLGTTSLAKSDTPRNLYEKVVFLARATGTVSLQVTGVFLDAPSVPFALAATEVPPPYIPGSFTAFGKGCPGTGKSIGLGAIAPKAYATKMGTSGSTVPLGYRPLKFQELVSPTELPSTLVINGLSFRRDDRYYRAISNYWIVVTIQLGYAKTTTRTMSRYFASNVSGTLTTVLSNTKVSLPNVTGTNTSPANFDVKFPFTKPFVYTSSANKPLLVQIVKSGASTGSSYAYYYSDWAYDRVNYPVSYIYSPTPSATFGYGTFGFGPILGFMKPASNNAVPLLSATGTPEIGQSFALNLRQAKANTVAAVMLGASATNWGSVKLPFDLTPLGATSCFLYVSPDFLLPLKTDANGTGALTLPVPLDKTLIQGLFHVQTLIVDPTANKFGLVFTNGLHGRVGGQP